MAASNWGVGNLGRVQLVDIDGVPYTAQFVNQVVEGGEIDTTALAKQSTQEEVLTALHDLQASSLESRPVTVENPEMPLPVGASTSALQTQQLNRLNELYTLLASDLSVVLDNDEALNVAVASLPLPAGASSAEKQDALLAVIQAGVSVNVANDITADITSLPPVEFAPNQAVSVTGTVNVGNTTPVPVSGTVALESNDVDATVVGPVQLSGSNAPLPVTANSTFPIQGPVSQSGPWSVGINNFPVTQPVSLTSVPTHPVTQSGTWNVTNTMAAPSATGAAVTSYRNAAVLAAPQAVKAGAGRVFNYHFANPNNGWVYVHLYNAVPGSVTVGTTVPLVSLGVPANSVLDGAWMFSYNFSTAISVAVTTTAAGTTAPSTGVLTDLGYV